MKDSRTPGIKRLRPLLRLLAAAAGTAVLLALPLNWGQVGRTLTLLAAGLRQPEGAATVLAGRLTAAEKRPPAQTIVTPPAATEPAVSEPDTGDTTAPQLPDMPAVSQTVLSVTPPGADGSGGKIYELKMPDGEDLLEGIAIQNRSGKAVDIAAALRRELPQRWQDTAEPQVLIIHTHTTEGYMLYDAGYYNAADRARTRDERRNVCAVGEAVKHTLEQAGIGVIHDTTVHDDPQYSGAYSRSAETVQKNLKKYPSIRVVLDLHRDAIMEGDTGLVKPTVKVNGRKAAQMMIIAGVVSTAALPHKNWEQNLTLAARWQQALNEAYPGLMRPLNTVASRYNQQLSTGYLLVEVGSEGNTLAEAVYSGQLLGKTLAELLR